MGKSSAEFSVEILKAILAGFALTFLFACYLRLAPWLEGLQEVAAAEGRQLDFAVTAALAVAAVTALAAIATAALALVSSRSAAARVRELEDRLAALERRDAA